MWSHDVVGTSIGLAGDLKVGQYLKIPPRAMFVTQVWGTILGASRCCVGAPRPLMPASARARYVRCCRELWYGDVFTCSGAQSRLTLWPDDNSCHGVHRRLAAHGAEGPDRDRRLEVCVRSPPPVSASPGFVPNPAVAWRGLATTSGARTASRDVVWAVALMGDGRPASQRAVRAVAQQRRDNLVAREAALRAPRAVRLGPAQPALRHGADGPAVVRRQGACGGGGTGAEC